MPQRDPGQAFLSMMWNIKRSAQLILEQKYRQAKKAIKQALYLNPNFSNSIYIYSLIQKHEKNPNSTQLYKRSYNTNPCFHITLKKNDKQILKAIIKIIKDSIPKIKQKLEECSSSEWVDMMNSCSKFKDLDTCLYIIEIFDVVKKKLDDYTTYVFSNFGINLYQIGAYQKSVEMYAIAIAKYPNEFRYYNNSAILFYILEDFAKSQEYVFKSLAIKPNYGKSLFILSFSLAKTGRHQQAMQKIKSASEIAKDSLLYRLKIITNLLLYTQGLENSLMQLKNHIKIASQIIKQNKDDDTYFLSPQNRPLLTDAITFIQQNIEKYQAFKDKWNQYLRLLDDYLIRGHADKFNITIKMNEIAKSIDSAKGTATQNMENQQQQSANESQN